MPPTLRAPRVRGGTAGRRGFAKAGKGSAKSPMPTAAAARHNGGVRILIVEDEDAIAEPLVEGLRREGFDVDARRDRRRGARAAGAATSSCSTCACPTSTGSTSAGGCASARDVPIIVVTARGEEADRVVGLELGADDYVVKPFGLRELIARIRAVTRRTAARGRRHEPLRVGGLEVDERARRATLDGRELELTPKEFDLLAALARDPGAAVSRRRLLEEVWQTTLVRLDEDDRRPRRRAAQASSAIPAGSRRCAASASGCARP